MLLPDINGRGGGPPDRHDMGATTTLNGKHGGGNGSMSARNKYAADSAQDASKLIVPLLSLPGGMVTSASVSPPTSAPPTT